MRLITISWKRPCHCSGRQCTGVGTLGQPALDQKVKELQQDPGYQAADAGMEMGTTGEAPVGAVADAGSTAGYLAKKTSM